MCRGISQRSTTGRSELGRTSVIYQNVLHQRSRIQALDDQIVS